jgi:hypothetical protein
MNHRIAFTALSSALYISSGYITSTMAQDVYVEPMHLLSSNGKVEPERKITELLVKLINDDGLTAKVLESSDPASTSHAYVVTEFVQKKPLLEYPPCQPGLELIGKPVFSASLRKPDGTTLQLGEISGNVQLQKEEISCPSMKINQAAFEREVSKVLAKLVGAIKAKISQ